MLLLRRLAPIFLLVLALTVLTRPSAAADEISDGPAVIVLDGSGSMWGNIGTERPAKFDLARGALRQSLSSLSPQVRLGLMSFGQRRRADCSDVEVLASPEAGPPERILSIADKLSPKGKGPLALAIKEAAKQIPAGEAGSVIVIHDGPDNCWQDPCASAAEIAKTNPNTRVFLIGFGLEKADSQHLMCVARATKGRVFDAQDSTSLQSALNEALTLANLERVDPATGMAVPTPKAATPLAPAGAPGLRLTSSLSSERPPLNTAIQWSIANANQRDVPLTTARTREFAVDLSPGSYVVTARYGQATAQQTLEVKAEGPTVAKISLGAGILKLDALADKGGTALADPVVTVYAKDAGGTGGRPVWVGREASAQLVVPAGPYVVRVQDGLADQTTETTVAEGATAHVTPVLGTGRIELSAVEAANGQPIKDVSYTIDEDDPDSPQGRREVARSADPHAVFTLPAGTYYVTAQSGVAEQRDRIAVGSGATIKHVANFNLVSITVNTSTPTQDGAQPAQLPIVIRVLSEDAEQREIARANGSRGTFLLPPARYRVEASASGLNIKALGVVDLSNGRGGSVQLKLESGEISVSAAGASNRWRVQDSTGRTVMHSGPGGTASMRLAPGKYVLLSDSDTQRIEQAFDLKAGERRQLNPGTP
ncbi:VWA domain-containing protein [Hyphomicrobium sp.]|uniref:VWA domain-containing protein n=1 Tax=Hyphomicrobium sp. TaxID=82 RepID=UPI002E377CB0|nr:VWA domain-containing protein [Hyphomicrobium sp.]HEX2843358.1 VWA domain-containing protein [Hyphomicrobium sp.]